MNETRLQYLLELSLSKGVSVDEMEEIADLIALPENEILAKELLFNAYKLPKQEIDISSEKRDAILEAIYRSGSPIVKSANSSLIKWFSAAAAILITLSIGFFFYYHKSTPYTPSVKLARNVIVPGRNKAVLTLADGSRIMLNEANNGNIASQGSVEIKKTADGRLEYSGRSSALAQAQNEHGYNIVETPRGGKYQVILSDGTVVWLNAASSLKYPVKFENGERRVELSGEAYFEVAHNKKLPFRVVANKQTVGVLGTHFNMQAYKDETIWKTTLLEGSVRITCLKNTSLLNPGEQAETTEKGSISVSQADIEEAIAWKNGYFRFRSEEIESIMRKVSRWYDVEVQFKGGISDEKFSGMISSNKNIGQVLEILEATNAVHFKIEGRRVIVMR